MHSIQSVFFYRWYLFRCWCGWQCSHCIQLAKIVYCAVVHASSVFLPSSSVRCSPLQSNPLKPNCVLGLALLLVGWNIFGWHINSIWFAFFRLAFMQPSRCAAPAAVQFIRQREKWQIIYCKMKWKCVHCKVGWMEVLLLQWNGMGQNSAASKKTGFQLLCQLQSSTVVVSVWVMLLPFISIFTVQTNAIALYLSLSKGIGLLFVIFKGKKIYAKPANKVIKKSERKKAKRNYL